ncbi:MAG TPA: response regulator [Geobacteraceae bacterium]|nr:response regulator [Geobacteraceae bacterium]
MGNSQDLLEKLLVTFRAEAEDHIGSLSSILITLEREADGDERKRLVETLYRRMHTLKGAAHMVNLFDVVEACQSLESLLAALKRGDLTLGIDLLDRLHAAIDSLGRLIFREEGMESGEESLLLKGLILEMETLAKDAESEPAPIPHVPEPREAVESSAPSSGRPVAGETIKVPVQVLDALLLQAEELISAKLMAMELAEGLGGVASELSARRGERAHALDLIRTAGRKADGNGETGKLAGLVQNQVDFEGSLENRLEGLVKNAEKNLRALQGMVDNLLADMKKVHLLPFSALMAPLPKNIRDIARELGKEAELICSGAEIEIDRRILSELKEPLLHIIRNTIDHGIEQPGERQAAGKPTAGRVGISIGHCDGNRAELVIADDGRGIDVARVKGAAIRLDLLTPEQAESISDSEALQFIFDSGISTSPMVTSLSGRGLGLAIVRETLERLGGHVTVASRQGRGTEFRLVFPLSFATIRGLLVEVGVRTCLLPATNVESTARVPVAGIKTVENRETIAIDGRVVSLVRLADLLGLPRGSGDGPVEYLPVVILAAAEKRIAFTVDQVLEVREVLVKPLGPQLSRVRNVAGATVLGNGRVVPILNINDLMRSAVNISAAAAVPLSSVAKRDARPVRVLVAEDSITSRTLLKNILEASGFQVRTAIDGIDALTLLKTEEFDIVVSDVEMPRMDGFGLTAAIRQDKEFAGLPVVLVTGLESREDRERGIDVGANAYIVKSSFDQSRLVEVIRKLT